MRSLKMVFLIVLVSLLALSAFCACASGGEADANVVEISKGNASSAQEQGELPSMNGEKIARNGENNAQKSGDTDKTAQDEKKGASASAQMDVIGKVESIIGNEVSLSLQTSPAEGDSGYTATGETGVYLIPVGMSVGNGDYSSVSEGMILGLSIEDDTVMSVRILKRAS